MANRKIPELPELTSVANDDLFYVVDISDTSESAQGTSKKVKKSNLTPTLQQVTAVGNTTTEDITVGGLINITAGNTVGDTIQISNETGDELLVNNLIQADGFKVLAGLSTEFLKADGSIDTNAYVVPNASITGATKTKITYDAKGLVTSGEDATTADIADSTDKRYVTDANLIVIENTSGTNTGDNATNTTSDTYADGKVSDTAYDESSWNGATGIAPSKNAVRDKIESLATVTKQYNTYFINTATGNNATGVFEDASKPFATIDYVNANFTITDGTIFYLQGTGQTYAINNQLQTASQSFIVDDTSTNTLDFSGNNNTNIAATQSAITYVINITMRNGFVRNNRSGGTGVNLNGSASYFTLKLDVREIYWNASTIMYSSNSILPLGVFKANVVSCAKILISYWSEYIHVRNFVCLSTGASLLPTCSNAFKTNIRIDTISGTGSYVFGTNGKYLIGDIATTIACYFDQTCGQESYITFNNSVITGGGILLPVSANNLVFSGVIRSVTSFTNSTPTSGIFKFVNFTADFGTNKLNVNGTSTISFENCSIKSTNSPLGVVTNVSGGNFIIKNSTFEVVNAVPLMTGGAGGTRTLTIAGVSTNATMLSDQSGTGVTVTQFTNY